MPVQTLMTDAGCLSWDSGTLTLRLTVSAENYAASLGLAMFLLERSRPWAWQGVLRPHNQLWSREDSMAAPEFTPVWTTDDLFDTNSLAIMRKENGVWFCCSATDRIVLSPPRPAPAWWTPIPTVKP